ncbi:MAG: PAS domain S-box protein [Acidobacteria bacterium]|nr:MAG: PAS domain S-box protein [Acidobacteriota bacterium]
MPLLCWDCNRGFIVENEEIFFRMADQLPAMIWVAGPDGQRAHFNKYWLDFSGLPSESHLDNGWTEGVHPDDLPRCLDIYSRSFDRRQEFKMEYRLRRYDGEYRWLCDNGVPRFQVDGSFAGYIGSCFDITDSRLAVEALSRVTGRLMQTHELERMQIARDLHDDVGASLGTLGIELLRAGRSVSRSDVRNHPDFEAIYQKMQEIGSRVSRLCNQLHPPMLKYFGLGKAIEIECRKFSEECQIPTVCSCEDLPGKLDLVVALTFLRVVQEALQNACRHSRATKIVVTITAASGELSLTVSDDGVGFDPGQSRYAHGLGLVSMRERMRLVGGAFEICSQPGQGTKILCRAPLAQSTITFGSQSGPDLRFQAPKSDGD